MNQFLRSLGPQQQVAALFLIVFGILTLVSVGACMFTFRGRKQPEGSALQEAVK
jgi:phosphatidate cytidylyltransferase